jgi:hypothetical protein
MTTPNESFQEQFLDDLLVEAWFADRSQRILLKNDLRPLLQQRIISYIYWAINEKQAEKVGSLLENNQFEAVETYLASIIPNYDEFLMEIYAQFEDEYLEQMFQK